MREVHPHICTTWEPLAFARSPTSVAVCQKFAAENGAVKSEIRSPRVSCCTAASPAYIRVRPLEGRDRYTSGSVSTLPGDITIGTYDLFVCAINAQATMYLIVLNVLLSRWKSLILNNLLARCHTHMRGEVRLGSPTRNRLGRRFKRRNAQ